MKIKILSPPFVFLKNRGGGPKEHVRNGGDKLEFETIPNLCRKMHGNARNCIIAVRTAEKNYMIHRTALIHLNMSFYISFDLFKHALADFEILDFW